jgi:small ligand-binding sensory domain FIST
MAAFLHGHASHADWRQALAAAAAQIERQRRRAEPAPTLGFAYFSDRYAGDAAALFEALHERWPGVAWVGTVGVGVSASGVEHYDEPALSLLLAALPRESFQVFSGAHPLVLAAPHTALVHADPGTPDLAELIAEMSERTESGYLFGGLASSRGDVVHIADGVFRGGLSGVAFTRDVALVSRVTQGCQPIGPVRRITAAERNVVLELDGEPALEMLFADLGADPAQPRAALPKLQATLAGLSDAEPPRRFAPVPQGGASSLGRPGGGLRDDALARAGQFGDDTRVRHLVGLDPGRGAVAIADLVEPGMQLAFCQRDRDAARRDLIRICSEIREEAGAEPIAGAVYVSCTGRGGPHFGAPSAELRIVQHALGDVPLAGFFAGGEIGHRHLYGYTGVLTAFTAG